MQGSTLILSSRLKMVMENGGQLMLTRKASESASFAMLQKQERKQWMTNR